MELTYRTARLGDAQLLIELYNASFYDDYIRYGECPAYGRTRERMEKSIERYPKEIIYCNEDPVGVISVSDKGNGEYVLGCLCVIPPYQGKGIGTRAVQHMFDSLGDWKCITLITPADNVENIRFYTRKCGFQTGDKKQDGNVEVVTLIKKR